METKDTSREAQGRRTVNAGRTRSNAAGTAQRPRSNNAPQRSAGNVAGHRKTGNASHARESGAMPRKGQGQTGQRRSGAQTRTATAAPRRNPQAQRTAAAKRRRPTQPQPSPDVVYTQPAPFNRGRFVLSLLIVGAVVLALIFGMSIFFKVDIDKVTVSGANKYSALQIREASGIKDGENLLSISEPRIANNIHNALPYVNKVRVGIKLPDTVKIEIVELDVVYSIEAADGSWWLMRSDGGLVEKTNEADAGQHTKILGVLIADPVQGEKAVAAQPVPTETEDGETDTETGTETETETDTPPVTVPAQEQLSAAISIAQFLEDTGIIGEAASVDVTNLTDIQVWYGERFQILLGDTLELGYKIRVLKSTMDKMGDYQGGVLDVSFTTWPNEVGYTPFS